MAEDAEVGFEVWVAVGVVGAGVFAREVEPGVESLGGEGGDDAGRYLSVPGVFQEGAVGAPLAGSIGPVVVVDEDLHSLQ